MHCTYVGTWWCCRVKMMKRFEFWVSKRFLVAVLMFVGNLSTFGLICNLNISIVEMTSSQTTVIQNQTVIHEPEFDWSSQKKGFILGVGSYGLVVPILAGKLIIKMGGATSMGLSALIISIINILTPIIVRFDFYLYAMVRIIEGALDSIRFVSITELWSYWSPKQEQSKLVAIGVSGAFAGPAIAYPICGFIIQMYGWPAAFYLTGGVCLFWSILWLLLVPNRPSSDKCISKQELAYIERDNEERGDFKNILSLWKGMLTSKHTYALWFSKFIFAVGFAIVVTCLPTYIKDITNAQIDKVGIYSAIPNIVTIFFVPLAGYAIDCLHSHKTLTLTKVHKLFICVPYIASGILLFLIAFLPPNLYISLLCLTFYKVALSASTVAITANCIVVAPRYSPILGGFIDTSFSAAYFIVPFVATSIVTNHSASQWQVCFMLFGITTFVGAVVYAVFGSSEPQSWACSIDSVTKVQDKRAT